MAGACPARCTCVEAGKQVICSANFSSVPADLLQADTLAASLQYSAITELPAYAFARQPVALRSLFVSNNRVLERVSDLAFANLRHLESLFLNVNDITELSTTALAPLVNLSTLSLSDTKLRRVPVLPPMPLKTLYFERNLAAALTRSALANVASTLESLAAKNHLRSYKTAPDLLRDCTRLVVVDFSYNLPAIVPDDFFGDGARSISSVGISVSSDLDARNLFGLIQLT
jgi:hypothetical protein